MLKYRIILMNNNDASISFAAKIGFDKDDFQFDSINDAYNALLDWK